MNTTTRTVTGRDIKTIVAVASGRWATAAEHVQSDLPGVSFLRQNLRTTVGDARVEVYADKRQWGAASVIVGGVGHLITPTEQMRAAFRVNGCHTITD
ncbi:MAG: hypothetical protein L0G94_14040 [Brachybacterium sp.]|uniref:hypothetical protein n=1 Tax=Brachybacterium sp. TaxID=1891286 RepID=UPI002648887A|nr:hypothetical protein [Brachybacterium sp.]MDN5687773.1 hypothetical protein [Brachybacterium sp.]